MIVFATMQDLIAALKRAETAHAEHEKSTGLTDHNWPEWYAENMFINHTHPEMHIIRVDSMQPLYYGPFTGDDAREASGELQDKFEMGTSTYMMLPSVNSDYDKAAEFNDPNYVDTEQP